MKMNAFMQIPQGKLVAAVLMPLALGGCASSLIEVRQGSEQVAVAQADQVSQCKAIGKTTVSVLAEVGFISRGIDNVDANLLQLARNEAVNQGGDTRLASAPSRSTNVVPEQRSAQMGSGVYCLENCDLEGFGGTRN